MAEDRVLILTPAEAAAGTVKSIEIPGPPGVPTRTIRARIPPVHDGDLIKITGAIYVRIQVRESEGQPSDTPAEPTSSAEVSEPRSPRARSRTIHTAPSHHPGPPYPGSRRSRLRFSGRNERVAVVTTLVLLLGTVFFAILISNGTDSNNTADTPYTSPAVAPVQPPVPDLTYVPPPLPIPPTLSLPPPPTFPGLFGPGDDTPTPDPSTDSPTPSPFDQGTCLNGKLPDSRVAVRVTGVSEVPCDASDAHYKVIQAFNDTTDLHKCDNNPKTQYAFSAEFTEGGITVKSYVYCVIGLGSYAR